MTALQPSDRNKRDSDQTGVRVQRRKRQGRLHRHSPGTYSEDNRAFLDQINFGNTGNGTLVLDMLKDAKPASL